MSVRLAACLLVCQRGFQWEISVKFDVWDFMKVCLENKTLVTVGQKCRAVLVKTLIGFIIALEVKSP
jgi:hypothetical protein